MTDPPAERTGAPSSRFRLHLGGILAVSALSVIPFLGLTTLWHIDEGRFAEISREMAQSGDWIVPRIGGQAYPCYPPLAFWLMGGSGLVFGFNEFAMRLPSALAGVALIAVVGSMARRLAGDRAGLAAAMVLATIPGFLVQQAAARADVLLMLCATVAFDRFLAIAEGDRRRRNLVLLYGAVALGILAKGPLAIVIPGLGIAAWLALNRRWAVFTDLKPWFGIPIVLLLVVPWYVAVFLAEGWSFLRVNLLLENVNAFATGNEHPAPLWAYLFWAPPRLGAWLVFFGLAGLARGSLRPKIGWAWLVAVALFLTITSAKRPNYLTYLYPPFALATGIVLAAFWAEAPGRARRIIGAFGLVLIVAAAVGGLAPIRWEGAAARLEPMMPAFAAIAFVGAVCLLGVTLFRTAAESTVALAAALSLGLAIHLAVAAPAMDAIGHEGAAFCRRIAASAGGERIATLGPDETEGAFHFYVGYPMLRREGDPGLYLLTDEQRDGLVRAGRRVEALDSVADRRGRLKLLARLGP